MDVFFWETLPWFCTQGKLKEINAGEHLILRQTHELGNMEVSVVRRPRFAAGLFAIV